MLTVLQLIEELALLQVAYTVARIVQVFPFIELPETDVNTETGKEKQDLTLVLSSGDGCVVSLKGLHSIHA